ncbi:histone deacetylase 6 [Neltuma alba]|uniref:histone deacetylase 6 n=1 Tax=Neltuma alba TaxID=207710 RepID=UPI0010A546D4|nr:histone deacetylase 6 [Prosopis alba]
MANAGASSSSQPEGLLEEEYDLIYGSESGWVEARTSCDHLGSLGTDLTHIPSPETPCNSCQHPSENWLCLSCKDVLCSRFVNKHMLQHYQQTSHSVALSFSDLSVWCFSCDAYLDAQVIPQLRAVHEIAYILKFKEAPPLRPINHPPSGDNRAENSSSGS